MHNYQLLLKCIGLRVIELFQIATLRSEWNDQYLITSENEKNKSGLTNNIS